MWVWVVLALAIIVLILLLNRSTSSFQDGIPKIIWSYWVQENPPELVQKCVSSWKKHCPDYEIRFLNRNTLSQWIPEFKLSAMKNNDSPARESDFIRVSLLSKYGGFWLDASTMLNRSLDYIRDVQSEKGCEVVGYYIEKSTTRPEYPVIENWFFACVPGSSFMQKLKEEFMSINDYADVDEYLKEKRKSGVDFQEIDGPNYLAMHVSAQVVMQKHMGPEEVAKKLHLMKAEDGPLAHIRDGLLGELPNIKDICDNGSSSPFVKFTSIDRKFLNVIETFGACKYLD
jgi:hypothetical protein